MTPLKFLLVGSEFVKGAKAVLGEGLPQGARVSLKHDQWNEFDAKAVRVWVEDEGEVRKGNKLLEALGKSGISTIEFPFPLGFLAADGGSKTAKRAREEGIQFATREEWWERGEPVRGFLEFHSCGVVGVRVEEGKKENEGV